jgi:hypothetical protein
MRHQLHHSRPALVVFLALFAVIASLIVIGETSTASTTATQGSERVCYPASSWAPAPDSERPCVTVEGLYEDGSGRLAFGSAGTVKATCTVPNVAEERGTFTLQCHRTQRGGVAAR